MVNNKKSKCIYNYDTVCVNADSFYCADFVTDYECSTCGYKVVEKEIKGGKVNANRE